MQGLAQCLELGPAGAPQSGPVAVRWRSCLDKGGQGPSDVGRLGGAVSEATGDQSGAFQLWMELGNRSREAEFDGLGGMQPTLPVNCFDSYWFSVGK